MSLPQFRWQPETHFLENTDICISSLFSSSRPRGPLSFLSCSCARGPYSNPTLLRPRCFREEAEKRRVDRVGGSAEAPKLGGGWSSRGRGRDSALAVQGLLAPKGSLRSRLTSLLCRPPQIHAGRAVSPQFSQLCGTSPGLCRSPLATCAQWPHSLSPWSSRVTAHQGP